MGSFLQNQKLQVASPRYSKIIWLSLHDFDRFRQVKSANYVQSLQTQQKSDPSQDRGPDDEILSRRHGLIVLHRHFQDLRSLAER